MLTQSQRSLSLLEVAVAAGILLVVILSLASGMNSAMALDRLTRERTHALHRASSVMDDVLTTGWSSIPARNGETFDVSIAHTSGSTPLEPGGGRVAPGLITVTSPRADLLCVEVSVLWRSAGTGSDVEITTQTMIGRH